MDGAERLYYALGKLAYVIAKADGKINFEERNKLHDLAVEKIKCHNHDFNVSEIIFHILQKDKDITMESTYKSAIKEIKMYSNFLTNDMKIEFVDVLDIIARAFNSVTKEEREFIERFKLDINNI